jgi:hypothetical protein
MPSARSPKKKPAPKVSAGAVPTRVPADDSLAIVWWPIADVTPYDKNPRKNDGAVEKVKASLHEFGWRQPIVVDEEGVVIVGHTRLKAALALGMERVPVHIARGLSPAKVKAYRLADNRTAEEANWDIPLLVEELAALRLDEDLSLESLGAFTGFDLHELERIMGETVGGAGARGDVPTELGIYVTCTSEQHQQALYDRLTMEGLACKVIA